MAEIPAELSAVAFPTLSEADLTDIAECPELDVRRFPPSQRLRGRRKTGVHPKVVQQAVGIERQEIRLIAGHRLFEWTVEQPHGLWREWPRRALDLVRHTWRDRRGHVAIWSGGTRKAAARDQQEQNRRGASRHE